MARRDLRHSAGRAERWLPVLLVLALLASAGAAHQFELGPRWFGLGEDRAETDPAAVEPPQGLVLPAAAAPRAVA
ncbi:hypothetical protein, partial [Nocardioides sp.]|uniref:hypothetical protein n=1 Tax=Nocardioides sp. TaxID=35761 RepID=UPI00273498F4